MSGSTGVPLPYPNPTVSFPVSYGTRPDASKPGMGPAVCPLMLPFTPTQLSFTVSLNTVFPFGLSNIQTMFIDNSSSPTRTVVTFPIGGETIVAEPFTRGFYTCATNTQTFTATNIAAVNTPVNISVYNFLIPPIVTNATGLRLGSGDQVLPDRDATRVGVGTFTLGLNTPFPFPNFLASPFYYVSAFSIQAQMTNLTSGSACLFTLYDSHDGGTTMDKVFWQGGFASSAQYVLSNADVSGIMISGAFQLYGRCSNVLGSQFGQLSANVYGGTTAALF